ncbi:MAG: GNAT family N-acetyltransferase [Chloroflexi bacterium]|nr:GNAT family N-acetyltransferase [Chloroflexota bacterium]
MEQELLELQDGVVPLRPEDLAWIAIDWNRSRSWEELRRCILEHPYLAWRLADGKSYTIGGFWRQRREIGVIEELGGSRGRSQLLCRLIQTYREGGARLIVIDFTAQPQPLSLLSQLNFSPIDHIVYYEKLGCHHPDCESVPDMRPYASSEREGILDVDQAAFPWLWWNSAAELEEYSTTRDVHLFTARDGESIVGYVGFTLRHQWAHLDRIAIHPKYQGTGWGKGLLGFALNTMEQLGVHRVTLNTQTTNKAAQAIYHRFGFRRMPLNYTLYGLWLDENPA